MSPHPLSVAIISLPPPPPAMPENKTGTRQAATTSLPFFPAVVLCGVVEGSNNLSLPSITSECWGCASVCVCVGWRGGGWGMG